ncbi:MAG TPA: DUF423 domain-containing protein [Cyclobacteriaceae bacterium]|nr:DUF423 domain-containing protein [Cyclobacteriaceae bacterium]
MSQRIILVIASILGFFAVAIGAFGAHALKATLEANGRAETFELGTRYQFYHALALLVAGILAEKFPGMSTAAILFAAGTIVFSGSLYILSLTGQTMWGAVTPIGGLLLLGGWALMAWSFFKGR